VSLGYKHRTRGSVLIELFSCRPQVEFDPNDDKISDKLRSRIVGWFRSHPNSQFEQYGPLNTYFLQKFPKALVKPQPLVYRELSNIENTLLQGYIDGKEINQEDSTQAQKIIDNFKKEEYIRRRDSISASKSLVKPHTSCHLSDLAFVSPLSSLRLRLQERLYVPRFPYL
jgi:hypothetical protein